MENIRKRGNLMKKILLIVFALILVLPTISAKAATDSLGYEYEIKTANQIDYEDGNFFISLLSGDPLSEDALYAVYENSELEKYEASINNPIKTDMIRAAALPTKFSEFYSGSKWNTRNDGVTLSLNPKKAAWAKNPSPIVQAHYEKTRWDVVYNKHKKDKQWKNTASMKAQLKCHAETVRGIKNPWNIEPWRTTSNYAKVLRKACNPPVGY
jgi:hypothetical protein